jgi:ribose 5-phosphate isomerase A
MKERNPTGESPEKKAAGIAAADLVQDGMVVGLGTGSTTAYTIAELGRRVDEGLDIIAVVTSYQSEMLAIQAGIMLTSLAEHPDLDIAIDGADQIDSGLNVIKGGGAAHTREKVVSRSAERFVVVADESKYSEQLNHYVPLEVLPYAKEYVSQQVRRIGGKDGPVITDNGNFVIDASLGVIENPVVTSALLSQIAGIVEHGIFTNVDEVYIGKKDGSVEIMA